MSNAMDKRQILQNVYIMDGMNTIVLMIRKCLLSVLVSPILNLYYHGQLAIYCIELYSAGCGSCEFGGKPLKGFFHLFNTPLNARNYSIFEGCIESFKLFNKPTFSHPRSPFLALTLAWIVALLSYFSILVTFVTFLSTST